MTEPFLTQKGLDNYWGYNTLAFFAPEPRYATRAAQLAGPEAVLAEVKGMVSTLHAAGLEVLLDVVYNHTCEGGADGPTLSLRGLDNTGYYLHDGAHPGRLVDVTGTRQLPGLPPHPRGAAGAGLAALLGGEVGVDGFRFDLAVTLGRNGAEFTPYHPFLVAMATDPVLADTKLVAEPWDLGPGGWRTGQFPATRWRTGTTGSVTRCAASGWPTPGPQSKGQPGRDLRELATRLSGSADLFGLGRGPRRARAARVDQLRHRPRRVHLADLVAYDHKHNEANLEDNRDGSDDNRSWNHGVEGPVRRDSPFAVVLPLRRRSHAQPAGHPAALRRHPDDHRRGRDSAAPSTATTTPTARTTRSPGWTGTCSRGARTCSPPPPTCCGCAASTGCCGPPGSPPAGRRPATTSPTWGGSTPPGQPMTPQQWHDPHHRVLQMLRSGFRFGGRRRPDDPQRLARPAGGHPARRPRERLRAGVGLRVGAPGLLPDASSDSEPFSLVASPGEAVELEALSMRLYLAGDPPRAGRPTGRRTHARAGTTPPAGRA